MPTPAPPVRSGTVRHLIACFLPQLPLALLFAGIIGRGYWLLLPILLLLVVVPVLDLVTGWQDDDHFEKEDFSSMELRLLQWNPRIYALLYMGMVTAVAMRIEQFSAFEVTCLIATGSLLGAIGFSAAHELLHAKESVDQILQRITTVFLFYPHYKLIHIRSHHVHASTEHDENTAWFNESIYAYIARTIPGSMIRSWQLEAKRVASADRGRVKGLIGNKMVSYAVGQVVLLLVLGGLGGIPGLLFYFAQVIGAHVMLESVNYIQHYGLLRKQENGEYEKTGAEHSWDTYHFFSSYVAFRVGHHSYHHIAVKPYYLLGTELDAPKLPTGYFWAIGMVFLPAWWRRIINPRLKVVAARSLSNERESLAERV